jgi:transglutaminase-like putative cysteine protease
MRLRIAHSIVHRYEPPATGIIQMLRLSPRNHDGQYVLNWRIDVSGDARLNAHDDAFGNRTHVFAADGPFAELSVNVEGDVETQNTDGVVRGTLERFPPSLFLRSTPLTEADDAMRDLAHELRAADAEDTLAQLHALLDRLHAEIACDDGAAGVPTSTAAETFKHKRGDARDLTHVFLGTARCLQIPARFVAGYLCGRAKPEDQEGGRNGSPKGAAAEDHGGANGGTLEGALEGALEGVLGGAHSWAEAYVPRLGWVGFDIAHCVCPTEAHVRVAVGLDAFGAAPVRGTRYGAGQEIAAVAVRIDQ